MRPGLDSWLPIEGREGPQPGQDLGAWAVEADQVVPALRDRKRVALRVTVSTESDRDGPVGVVGSGDVVDAVRAALVGLEEPGGVVHRDRPEPVDRDVADGELVLADRKAG